MEPKKSTRTVRRLNIVIEDVDGVRMCECRVLDGDDGHLTGLLRQPWDSGKWADLFVRFVARRIMAVN